MMMQASRTMPLLRKTRILSVLDVGSSKIVCLIARLRPASAHHTLSSRTHTVEILGFGMQKSRGIKAGVVVDMQAVEQSIRLSVDAAERMSGFIIDSVLVNFSSRQQKSHRLEAQLVLDGKVNRRDIRRVLASGSRAAFNMERPVVHSLPLSFQLDDEPGIDDPLGMIGEVLKVDMHVVSVEKTQLRHLEQCINRAHLSVEAVVPTALASSLSVFVGDEAKLGACCIDMGAGTTNLSVFSQGKFVHGETLPIGAHHITLDIARLLSISVEEAERLKVLHGSVLDTGCEDRDLITMTRADSEEGLPGQYPRAFLSRIIRARVEEIFEILRDRLKSCGVGGAASQRLVLTGGGVGLTGLVSYVRHVMAAHVRMGRPLGLSGLPERARGPAFSVAGGLLIYPQSHALGILAGESSFVPPAALYEDKKRGIFTPFSRARAFFGKAGSHGN